MEPVEGMTKQGVRNLNNLGPKRKKLEAVEPAPVQADPDAAPIEAPPELNAETPAIAIDVAR